MSETPIESVHKTLYDWEDVVPDERLITCLFERNYDNPSKIQYNLLNFINNNKKQSVVAQAPNGSGKTLSFIISLFQTIDVNNNNLQVIVLLPNQQIADQTKNHYLDYFCQELGVSVCYFYPTNKSPDLNKQILCCSPAIFTVQNVNYSNLKLLIIDESDIFYTLSGVKAQMENFFRTTESISYQTLLFSATMNPESDAFNWYKCFINNLGHVCTDGLVLQKETQHFCIQVDDENEKNQVIIDLFDLIDQAQSFIFFNKKIDNEQLKYDLDQKGYKTQVFNSNSSQAERQKVLNSFRNNEFRVILCTDSLSRGVDIPSSKMVINYDMPMYDQINTYIQRQGRCGRFGREGFVINIIMNEKEEQVIQEIENSNSISIPRITKSEIRSIIKKH